MKVTQAQIDTIKTIIDFTGYDNDENRRRYRLRDIPRGDAVQDINKRYRWELFLAANTRVNHTLLRALYETGCNDNHIDTALKQIVKPL